MTTFPKNLATQIRAQLVTLAGPAALDRVEVLNIDALASRTLRSNAVLRSGARLISDDDEEVKQNWEIASRRPGGEPARWEPAFLDAEWRSIILAQGIRSREDYLMAPRAGRGRRLSRPQRAEVWQAVERFTQLMSAGERVTFMQAADQAAGIAAGGYRHVVVDEAQDLHPAHWRLLRAVVPLGPDDLFIVGDAHQRIYGRPVVLSRCGIETRGRSRRLTVNYRTSRQILRWCLAVAGADPVDDLEGETETLAGARSAFGGPEPQIQSFADSAAEAAGLAERLRAWASEGIGWAEMAVLTRDHRSLDHIEQELKTAGCPVARIQAATEESTLADAVRLMTMHRAKGLEYRAVAIVRADAAHLPPQWVDELPDEEAELQRRKERNVLYVAASRARERLWISWSGVKSSLLP